ncbi:hypothetical protein CLAFUW4_03217 [Fulvia fulva]|uniref:F-box domain-containing protein n=1 Tax=Passalora fulva TaxID=5499 RepID=A0A9Q8P560_PASFU|nr:uncharacterized protein CLAFUR5_03200 [Fulvia fulva]KAK4631334.1 hypothetical protein CLAFUR4_03206 [Fulvia fulva]KAK4633514.1 hypothetical protein CLAFUR0_03210 [Fulvia fulva]UJO13427.1 hypothetical protein CLAFUR5_03200 [Fulvia fulva]WPV11904.1 hypothetical protein CLAFUW4_03217 [Fulvia fulva]WPV26487.1 hypothetical protein CLAFUW7_03210 [Fulvia fulva]
MAITLASLIKSLDKISLEDLQQLDHNIVRAKNAMSCPLLRIPAELRNCIWYLASVADLKHQHKLNQDTAALGPVQDRPLHPPCFINTCRQIRAEAAPILFDSIMIWEEWLGNDFFPALNNPRAYPFLWTKLAPHQIMSLQLERRYYLPTLAIRYNYADDLPKAWAAVTLR